MSPSGATIFGDASTWSFHPSSEPDTGPGGLWMIDEELALYYYDYATEEIETFDLTSGGYSFFDGLAVDPNTSQLFLLEASTNVVKLATDMTVQWYWESSEGFTSWQIAVQSDGTLVLNDGGFIALIAPDGTATLSSDLGNRATEVAVDSDDSIYFICPNFSDFDGLSKWTADGSTEVWYRADTSFSGNLVRGLSIPAESGLVFVRLSTNEEPIINILDADTGTLADSIALADFGVVGNNLVVTGMWPTTGGVLVLARLEDFSDAYRLFKFDTAGALVWTSSDFPGTAGNPGFRNVTTASGAIYGGGAASSSYDRKRDLFVIASDGTGPDLVVADAVAATTFGISAIVEL